MIYKKIQANTKNYDRTRRSRKRIKFIVIHYTGNKNDTAANNGKYFRDTVTKTSAHWFVDRSGQIVRSVPMTRAAYSVGGGLQSQNGGTYYRDCTNVNSISIELCGIACRDGVSEKQLKALKTLVKYVKSKCPNAKYLIRHYDVNGKNCPEPYINKAKWKHLKKDIICKGVI